MSWKDAVAVALFVLTAGSASAATYYVSTSGSDASNGALATPFLTIGKAAGIAKAGDVVDVRGGVYYGKVVISSVGTSAAHVTFQSYPGETAVLDGTGTASGTDVLTLASANYVDVIGFEVRNATKIGITIWASSNVSILDCNVHNNTRNGIYAGASAMGGCANITASGNNVHDNVLENQFGTMTGGGWASALTLSYTNGGTITNNTVYNNYGEGIDTILANGCVVRGNTVHDNYSVNIYLDNAAGGTIDGNLVYTTNNSAFYRSGYPASGIQVANETYSASNPSSSDTITNNIVIGGRWGFYYGSYGNGGGLKYFTIANNTFYRAGQTLLSIDADAGHSGTVIENNIFDQVGNVMTAVPSTAGISYSHNNWYGGNAGNAAGAGDVLADPRLSNPGGTTAPDYKLTSLTPLTAAGVSVSVVGSDYFGTPRASVNDVGAHQLSGTVSADTQAPTSPTGLMVASVTTSSVTISWNASTDNIGVAGYNVYRNGTKVASVSGTSWTDSITGQSVGAQTTFNYQVAAYDAAGNVSSLSAGLTAGVSPIQAGSGSYPATPAPTMPTVPKKRRAVH